MLSFAPLGVSLRPTAAAATTPIFRQSLLLFLSLAIMVSLSGVVEKALSPAYYQQQWKAFTINSYNYYHPMFRAGSATPLFHMMVVVAGVMYTCSYIARDHPAIQHKHEVEKEAMKEYYDKHGGAPHH